MALPKDGVWPATVIEGSAGDNYKGVFSAMLEFELTAGPDKGSRMKYEEPIDNKSGPYIARNCAAVGWRGKDILTLAADVEAFRNSPTKGETTIEIKHMTRKDGSGSWAKIASVGSSRLSAAKPETIKEANEYLRGFGNSDNTDIPF